MLLLVNVAAAVVLALSFQASSSGLKIVTVPHFWDSQTRTTHERDYICVGNVIALWTDDYGRVAIGNVAPQGAIQSVTPCPLGAQSAAIVTVDNAFWFKAALIAMAVSALFQIFLVRRE